MKAHTKKIEGLLHEYKEIALLGQINSVLGWDLNVNLPPKGVESRAAQSAYLTELTTEKWQNDRLKNLLEQVDIESKKLTPEEKSIVRNLNHTGRFYWRVPKEIVVEFSETTSKAFMAWQYAKRDNKFKDFLPLLKKVVSLSKIVAEHLGYRDNPYDALLDLYEPGLTTAECKNIFGTLRPELTKLLKKIQKSKAYDDSSVLIDGQYRYPIEDQKQLAHFVLRKMNYDLDAGRMDVSSHPFTETLGKYDVRITDRYKETDFRESLMGAMHEAGHALYEQGVNEEYELTPLDGGVSLGIHESQSRFWENQVGRSREFTKFMTPIYHAFYPEQLGKVGTEEIFALMNMVKPSFIRTESDEVTYNLHIALRFEIEEALINDKIKSEDLPEIWKEKMKKYLGVAPKTDREGVLQDVHWSYGSFGYFPTYTLGNLYAAQFTRKLKNDLPKQAGSTLEVLVERGELGSILSWLRTNIHQYGSLYLPKDLCKKVCGEYLNSKYFLDYINSKYSKIYGINS